MQFDDIQKLASAISAHSQHAERFMIAIAGPPGAGKSTLSEMLAAALPETSAILQADGFRYDAILLKKLDRLSRKGAPDTFDTRGLELTLRRLRSREPEVVAPTFERVGNLARGGSIMIDANTKYVIAEGNYFAFERGPWAAMRQYFDTTIYVNVDAVELRERLIRRWTDTGWTEDGILQWVENNDLRNANIVMETSQRMDMIWGIPMAPPLDSAPQDIMTLDDRPGPGSFD